MSISSEKRVTLMPAGNQRGTVKLTRGLRHLKPSQPLRPTTRRFLKRLAGAPAFFAGKALNQVLETSAQLADRCLYKPHVAWWNDRSWLRPYERYLDGERILDRRFTLVQWARAARDL